MPSPSRAEPDRFATIPDVHVHALRDALARHGYDGEMLGACEAWAPGQLDAVRVPLVLHELRRRQDPAAAIARWFAYDDALTRREAEGLLGAATVDALLVGGVLVPRGELIGSAVRIIPFETLWIASDDWARTEDPVMGPGPTTLELARALDTTDATSLLDIGCGAGSLALLGRARGVPHVTGIDIDARALDYARFNTRFNRLECEWLLGDLGAPVAGRRFDVVVSQPAYVPRPAAVGATTYLHGGARGDELALRLLRELPPLLDARGRGWVLFDTPGAAGRLLVERVRAALGPVPLDAIVVAPPKQSTRAHTVAYASLVDGDLGADYRDAVEHYAAHFETLAIDTLCHVLVHVERTSDDRAASVLLEPANMRGIDAELLARLRAGIRAAARSDAELLDADIVPASDAVLVYEEALGGAQRSRYRVQFERTRGLEQTLSDTAAVLLQSLRDHQPLRAAIQALAEALDTDVREVGVTVPEFVRRGLVSGLLVAR